MSATEPPQLLFEVTQSGRGTPGFANETGSAGAGTPVPQKRKRAKKGEKAEKPPAKTRRKSKYVFS